PDGNFLAPEQRFLHGGGPVSRVVSGVVLEFLHARTEPLVSIVVIIGDAGAEDIEERESLVHDTLLDQFGEMLLFAAEAAGDKSGACGESERNGVNRSLDVAEGHAFGFHSEAAGGRG